MKGSIGCIPIVIYLVLAFLIGGFCTEYVVEFWGSRILERAVDVPFLVCGLASVFVGGVTVPVAIMTLLLSPFL